MKLGDLTGPPLPKGGGGVRTSTAGEQAGVAELAWRREMERAQSDTWFLGVLPTSASQHGALSDAASLKPAQVAMAHGGQPVVPSSAAGLAKHQAARAGTRSNERSEETMSSHAVGEFRSQRQVSLAAASGRAAALPADGVVLLRQSTDMALRLAALTASRNADEISVDVHIGAPTEDVPAADEGAAPVSTNSRLPVRVHVEGDGTRSTVWLGVDPAALAQLPSLTAAVRRWLTHSGYGAPTWICNGRPLNPDQFAENTDVVVQQAESVRLATHSRLLTSDQIPGETP